MQEAPPGSGVWLAGEGAAVILGDLRIELFVEDVERSLAFYAAALGLRPAAGYDPQGYSAAPRCPPAITSVLRISPARAASAWRSWSKWTT